MRSYLVKICSVIILSLSTVFSVQSQGYNGEQANDWTMTDIDGTTWNLYTLLDEGKTVYLDFSATWCGICWNFHSSHAFEEIYNQYGPDGTDEVMVFFIEADATTDPDCIYGSGNCNGNSMGDWTAGVSYPIINAPDEDVLNLKSEYEIFGYPSLNIVCPSGRKFVLPNTNSSEFLANYIQSCELSIDAVDVTDSQCNGEPSGAIDLTVSGGYNDLTYTWNNGEMTEDLSGLEAGTYSCTVRDQNQVFVSTIVEVLSPSPLLELTVEENATPTCYGGNDGEVTVVGTGAENLTYTWDDGLTGSTRNDLSAGTYAIILTDENGCTLTDSVTVDNPLEVLLDVSLTPQGCNELGTATITVTQGEGDFTYDIGEGPQENNSFSDLESGIYTVTVTNILGCTTDTTFTIEQDELPSIVGPTEDLVIDCFQENFVIDFSDSDSGGNISYSWSTTDGNIVSGQNSAAVTVNSNGMYTFTLTDITTGCSQSVTVEVQENDPPIANAGIDHTLFCDDDNYILNAENSSSGDQFLINWTTTDGNILGGANTLQPLIDAPGIYVLNIVNIDNQCTAIDTVIIDLYDNTPTADFTFEKEIYTVDFTSNSEGDLNTYLWDFGDSNTSSEENPTHTYTNPGSYNVCLTTSNECGTDQKCSTVSINEVEISIQSEVQDVSCFEAEDGAISITNISELTITSYQWSSGQTTGSIDGLSGGEYSLTMTSEEGISATYNFTVEEPEELIAEVSLIDNENGVINLNVTGGTPPYKFTWNNGSQEQNQQDLDPGTYAVSIKDANNCRTELTGLEILVTSVKDVSLRSNINMYPNPVQDLLHLDFNVQIKESGSLTIYNTEGKEVYRKNIEKFENQLEIDLNQLSPGNYYIVLKTLQESAILNFIKT